MSGRSLVLDHALRRGSRSGKRRSYNTRLIKRDFPYSIHEVAELYGLHPQAVRRWVKSGLRRIDDRRPTYIHGSDLIAFLTARQSERKRKCCPDEFFCCRCRTPRRTQYGRIDVKIRNEKQVHLAGFCEACGARMNKAGSLRKLTEYRQTFCVQTTVDRRISDCSKPRVMCHLDEENDDATIQSAQ